MSRCPVLDPSGERCSLDDGHFPATKHRLAPEVHRCHARGCTTPVKPEMLMCLKHWRMVPKSIQRQVWSAYRAGQCDDKNPSASWHAAADAAISVVAQTERTIAIETERIMTRKEPCT